MSPNGIQFFGSTGVAPPQSLQWSNYGRMYEFYQVEGFSCEIRPTKFEFAVDQNGNNVTVQHQPSWSCLDPEADFPQTPSSILAYNASKTVNPLGTHVNVCKNYKALSIQKQVKTILSTADGSVVNREVYDNPAGYVTYIANPISGVETGQLAWCDFTTTVTFSGLKRPGATQAETIPKSVLNQTCGNRAVVAKEPRERDDNTAQPQSPEGNLSVSTVNLTEEAELLQRLAQLRSNDQPHPPNSSRGK